MLPQAKHHQTWTRTWERAENSFPSRAVRRWEDTIKPDSKSHKGLSHEIEAEPWKSDPGNPSQLCHVSTRRDQKNGRTILRAMTREGASQMSTLGTEEEEQECTQTDHASVEQGDCRPRAAGFCRHRNVASGGRPQSTAATKRKP